MYWLAIFKGQLTNWQTAHQYQMIETPEVPTANKNVTLLQMLFGRLFQEERPLQKSYGLISWYFEEGNQVKNGRKVMWKKLQGRKRLLRSCWLQGRILLRNCKKGKYSHQSVQIMIKYDPQKNQWGKAEFSKSMLDLVYQYQRHKRSSQ